MADEAEELREVLACENKDLQENLVAEVSHAC